MRASSVKRTASARELVDADGKHYPSTHYYIVLKHQYKLRWSYIKDLPGFLEEGGARLRFSAAKGNFMVGNDRFSVQISFAKTFCFTRSSFFLQLERFAVSEIA